jgi:DNA-binding transcriptional ArsR family regulator
LNVEKATELAAVFETLANDTRLRVLNVLVKGIEASPTELAEKVWHETPGDLESTQTSFRPRNHPTKARG